MADKDFNIDSFINYADKQGIEKDQATAIFYASRGSVIKDTKGDSEKMTPEEMGMLWGKFKDAIKSASDDSKKKESYPENLHKNKNIQYSVGLYDGMDDYSVYITIEESKKQFSINNYTHEGKLLGSSDISQYKENKWQKPSTAFIQDRLEEEILQFIDTFVEPYTEEIVNTLNLHIIQ